MIGRTHFSDFPANLSEFDAAIERFRPQPGSYRTFETVERVDSLAFGTTSALDVRTPLAAVCCRRPAIFSCLCVKLQGNHWITWENKWKKIKKADLKAHCQIDPDCQVETWTLDEMNPSTLHQVVVTFVLFQVVWKQRQHAWPRTQNFFQAMEAFRSLRMEIEFWCWKPCFNFRL